MLKTFNLFASVFCLVALAVTSTSVADLTTSGLTGSATFPSNPKEVTTITHSAAPNTVVAGSVSCNLAGLHANNSYYRSFDLAGFFNINNDFAIKSVDIGIEQAAGAGGSQPVAVNLYTGDIGNPGGWVSLDTLATNVADTMLTIQNFAFPGTPVAPSGSNLIVELFTPDGQAAGNSFFIGSNSSGQTAPSYIAAADCGIPAPTDLTAIGFPNMHIVMSVNGNVVPEPASGIMLLLGLLGSSALIRRR